MIGTIKRLDLGLLIKASSLNSPTPFSLASKYEVWTKLLEDAMTWKCFLAQQTFVLEHLPIGDLGLGQLVDEM